MSFFNDDFLFDDEDRYSGKPITIHSEAERVLKRISDEQYTWRKTRSSDRDSEVQKLVEAKKISDLEIASLNKSIVVLKREKSELTEKLKKSEKNPENQVLFSDADAEVEAVLQELEVYLNG